MFVQWQKKCMYGDFILTSDYSHDSLTEFSKHLAGDGCSEPYKYHTTSQLTCFSYTAKLSLVDANKRVERDKIRHNLQLIKTLALHL